MNCGVVPCTVAAATVFSCSGRGVVVVFGCFASDVEGGSMASSPSSDGMYYGVVPDAVAVATFSSYSGRGVIVCFRSDRILRSIVVRQILRWTAKTTKKIIAPHMRSRTTMNMSSRRF